MTDDNKKIVRVLCIYYLIQFREKKVRALFNSGNKINAINLNFAHKLGFYIQKTSVRAQKINSSTLKIFKIVIANFQIKDKVNKLKFF